jgi:hypothetical protein
VNCSYILYLPCKKGDCPYRLIVRKGDSGIVIEAHQYLHYGKWESTIWSSPRTVASGLVRLLSSCRDSKYMETSRYPGGIPVKALIEFQLVLLTNALPSFAQEAIS